MSKDLDVNKLMDNVKALTIENENLLGLKTTRMRTVFSLKESYRTERAWTKRVCWRAWKMINLIL